MKLVEVTGPPDPAPPSSTPAMPTGSAKRSTTVLPSWAGSTSSSPTPVSRLRRRGTTSPRRLPRCHGHVNVTGTWNTVMAGRAEDRRRRGRGGSIILISSAAGVKLQPFMVHYTASKHAVTGMARAFAAELGTHSIRVNSVHPGAVNTHDGHAATWSVRWARAIGASPQLAQMIRRRFCRTGRPSRRTSPTRCAGWPATSRKS